MRAARSRKTGARIPLGLAPRAADTGHVSNLLENLACELERPRELSTRVITYIRGTYGIDDDIGPFLVNELPTLEDDELDLILSPVFTPTLADQAIVADLLGKDSVPREQWPGLIQQLVARPTRAQLVTPEGRSHSLALRDVTIERYVHRLRLEATISESLFNLLDRIPSAADRAMLRAVARRPVWENEMRRNILFRYLTIALERGSYRLPDILELLHVVEAYKPANLADLRERIPHRQEVLRGEIDGGPKPFFSAGVQDMHGGARDQRRTDDVRSAAKQRELAFLERLLQTLGGD